MTNYRPRLIHWVIAALLILLTAVPAKAQDEVLLCHATGSETNPYVLIEVPLPAVENAHVDRTTGNLHGDQLGNQDFIVQEGETCDQETTPTPTPTPSSSPSSSPTPSPDGSAPVEPSPSLTVTSTASPFVPDTAMPANERIGLLLMIFGIGLVSLGLALTAVNVVTYLTHRRK